jgi:hypothetical protein
MGQLVLPNLLLHELPKELKQNLPGMDLLETKLSISARVS